MPAETLGAGLTNMDVGPTRELAHGSGAPSDVSGALDAGSQMSELIQEVASRDDVPLTSAAGEVLDTVSPEQHAVYAEADLRYQEVNGRDCLTRSDIDWEQTDGVGRSNLERAEQGLAPLDADGRPYDLHHVNQRPDGVLAELRQSEHQGNYRVLHPNRESDVEHGSNWQAERRAHWKARASEIRAQEA